MRPPPKSHLRRYLFLLAVVAVLLVFGHFELLLQSSLQSMTSQTTTLGTAVSFTYVVPETVATVPCGFDEGCITAESQYTVVRTITVSSNATATLTHFDYLAILILVVLVVAVAILLHFQKPYYAIKDRPKHPF